MEKQSHVSRVGEEFAEKMKKQSQTERFISLAPLAILIILVIIFSITAQGFFSVDNLHNLLNQAAMPLVMSLGLTFVILMGSTDLSAEGLGGFAGSVVALLVLNSKNDLNLGIWSFLIVILASVFVSVLSVVLHIKGKLPSFMVSYGVSNIMAGFAVLSYKGVPARIRDPLFIEMAQGNFLGIPYLTWVAFIMFCIALFLQKKTKFGSYVMAIGDNEAIAKNIGINIDLTKFKVFIWLGICIGVVGVMGAIRVGQGELGIGNNLVFPGITSVVVGGTSLSGGKGGVLNTLVGAFIVTVINNALVLLGVSSYIQSAVQGLIILAAVAVSVPHGKNLIVK